MRDWTHRSAAGLSQLHYVRIAIEREEERETHTQTHKVHYYSEWAWLMIPQLYKAHQGGRSGPTARTTLHSRNSREIKKESDDVNECVLPDLPALGWVVCVHTYRRGGWRSIKGSTSRWKKKRKRKKRSSEGAISETIRGRYGCCSSTKDVDDDEE